jgi:hypothetical protein
VWSLTGTSSAPGLPVFGGMSRRAHRRAPHEGRGCLEPAKFGGQKENAVGGTMPLPAKIYLGVLPGRGARADKKIRLTEITVSTANATAKGLKIAYFRLHKAAAGHGSLEVISLR